MWSSKAIFTATIVSLVVTMTITLLVRNKMKKIIENSIHNIVKQSSTPEEYMSNALGKIAPLKDVSQVIPQTSNKVQFKEVVVEAPFEAPTGCGKRWTKI